MDEKPTWSLDYDAPTLEYGDVLGFTLVLTQKTPFFLKAEDLAASLKGNFDEVQLLPVKSSLAEGQYQIELRGLLKHRLPGQYRTGNWVWEGEILEQGREYDIRSSQLAGHEGFISLKDWTGATSDSLGILGPLGAGLVALACLLLVLWRVIKKKPKLTSGESSDSPGDLSLLVQEALAAPDFPPPGLLKKIYKVSGSPKVLDPLVFGGRIPPQWREILIRLGGNP